MATSDAPISIGQVTLTVRDLDKTAAFYEGVIGLGLIDRTGDTARLGTEAATLIELRQDRQARAFPRDAGLFHTAFLLPSQQELGAWLINASERGVQLDGASHHGVSEALYLNDPEGNGIEIYRDLPRETWTRQGDTIEMDTLPLDLNVLAENAAPWNGAPQDTVIGHVHLRVGEVGEAARFITQNLGMVQTFSVPSARWFGSGGYHHHLAANEWHSKGAERRPDGAAGLSTVELLATPESLLPGRLIDPWGTEFVITTLPSSAT